jgi:hypothetical protein
VRESSIQTIRRTSEQKSRITMRFQGSTSPASTVTPPDIQPGFATSTFCAPNALRTPCIKSRLAPKVASSVSSGRP